MIFDGIICASRKQLGNLGLLCLASGSGLVGFFFSMLKEGERHSARAREREREGGGKGGGNYHMKKQEKEGERETVYIYKKKRLPIYCLVACGPR